MSDPTPAGVTVVSEQPPTQLLDALRRPRGAALMLGHVHPDGDVLGTLLGLGLAMEAAGWSVSYGGPDPVPAVLDFIPGGDRWQVWRTAPRRFDTVVLTDCPNDGRTEGLLAGVRAPDSQVLNIDHHPDNRRYGTVNWIDPSAAATGEMIFDLVKALGLRNAAVPFAHGAAHKAGAIGLYDSYHCSRYNTNTGVLTPKMFREVFARVRADLG